VLRQHGVPQLADGRLRRLCSSSSSSSSSGISTGRRSVAAVKGGAASQPQHGAVQRVQPRHRRHPRRRAEGELVDAGPAEPRVGQRGQDLGAAQAGRVQR
jgi:hypothetical protein